MPFLVLSSTYEPLKQETNPTCPSQTSS